MDDRMEKKMNKLYRNLMKNLFIKDLKGKTCSKVNKFEILLKSFCVI